MQLQYLKPKKPSFQNNINFTETISICRFIEKPRQLIDKLTINKIYPEEWEDYNSMLSSSIIGNLGEYHLHGTKKIQVDLNSTEMQVRSLDRIGSLKGRNKNQKYCRNRSRITLKQGEQLGIFGQLLYDRAKGRNNWIWPLNPPKFNVNIHNPKSTKTNQNQLQFNSQFQSGNLLRVYNSTTNPNLYTLLTHNDTNTFGYNQWFYFKVRSKKIFQPIRFQIINMRKHYSCFNKGMKIAIFNQGKLTQSKIGWERGGQNIQYSSSQIKINENSDFNDQLYTLGWDYRFQMKNQWVYFAYSYPYTYTDLRLAIQKTRKYKGDSKWIKLCSTALKNQLFMLKIENTTNQNKQKPQNQSQQLFKQPPQKTIENIQQKSVIKLNRLKNKKRQYSLNFKKQQNKISTLFQTKFFSKEIYKNNAKNQVKNQSIYTKQTKITKLSKIVDQGHDIGKQYKDILIIMGRAHPGQTPSSFMMQGVINSILKQTNNQAKYLKQNLSIYIIPMLNPDGVIHGNTRTSITGNDLNRRWTHPNSELHPQIQKIKQYFKKLTLDGRKIFAMVDLHAHTKKQSSFLYGCCDRKNYINHGEVRLLNTIIGKTDSNFNSLYSSHYISQSKKSTARVNFYRQFKCFSYTLQLSFLGANQSNFHFSTIDYYNLGENLLKSLAYFHAATKTKRKSLGLYSNSQTILTNSIVKKAIKQHFDSWKKQKNSKSEQYYKQEHSQGSSSAPSQCNYSQQYLLYNIINTKQSKNLSQSKSKSKSRYFTKSLNKVNRRSISISTQQKIKPQKQTSIQKQNKPVVKNRRIQIINRLPNINFPYKIQQKVQDDHMIEFHAFNFKSKKSIWRNNKKIIKNQQQFMLQSTIG